MSLIHDLLCTLTVWPNRCDILLTASCDVGLYNKYIQYWDNVYDFKMSCMRVQVCREALVQVVNNQHIVCQPAVIKVRNQCYYLLDCEIKFLFFCDCDVIVFHRFSKENNILSIQTGSHICLPVHCNVEKDRNQFPS